VHPGYRFEFCRLAKPYLLMNQIHVSIWLLFTRSNYNVFKL
jgi:hypothetical protein